MITRIITGLSCLLLTLTATAQLQAGKKNIEKLCGCFDVDFKYAETFSTDTAYKFHEREHSRGTELVLPIETSDKKIVLQHLLIVNDTMIVKHWREDWVYQSPELLTYQGNKVWTKQQQPSATVKNKWTQTVWEVDDAPRYQGTSEWVNVDGKTYWQNTTNAPLPRREYTKRKDYNILRRGNRIVVTDTAWYHEQDNDKVLKANGTETILAQEKGMNTYVKTSDAKCAAAKQWWDKNGAFWNKVRAEWEAVVKAQPSISLKSKVADKRLDEYFTALWKEWNNHTLTLEQLPARVKEVLQQFTAASDVATN